VASIQPLSSVAFLLFKKPRFFRGAKDDNPKSGVNGRRLSHAKQAGACGWAVNEAG